MHVRVVGQILKMDLRENNMKKKIKCLVCLDCENDVRGIYADNQDRDCGMHNLGITPEKYKELGIHFVIGTLTFDNKKTKGE